jgi:hypothetical protein
MRLQTQMVVLGRTKDRDLAVVGQFDSNGHTEREKARVSRDCDLANREQEDRGALGLP